MVMGLVRKIHEKIFKSYKKQDYLKSKLCFVIYLILGSGLCNYLLI